MKQFGDNLKSIKWDVDKSAKIYAQNKQKEVKQVEESI